MPLIRIDLVEGRSDEQIAAIGDTLMRTLVDVYSLPERDRFQIVTEHAPAVSPPSTSGSASSAPSRSSSSRSSRRPGAAPTRSRSSSAPWPRTWRRWASPARTW
jgi:hypothetical protein